jgi:RimJ/RimL family protein N-acetyltransferase
MILETERLLLRRMEQSDYHNLAEILQDPDVMYAYAHAFEDAEVQAWLNRQQERYRTDGYGLWAVILKKTGEMIGQCGLTQQDWSGTSVLEIGYLFKKEFWHQGYATEAAKACKAYAFDKLAADEVYSIIRDTNFASMNVAIRNGMLVRGWFVKHYYNIDMPHYVFSAKRIDA